MSASATKNPTESMRPCIWVLDDSPLEGSLAKRALSPFYDVELFTEGATLLERLAAGGNPHVLVLDWQLPGMSGLEVCKFLRATRNETELPILMLTVYGHKADLVEGLGAGANDYLSKPYDAPELAARVGTLVRVKQLQNHAKEEEAKNAELLVRAQTARSEAEAANRAKDDFLAMVSHDLRTPLNAILGWTQMIRGGSMDQEQVAKGLKTIERNAQSQAQLIEDLMDMSRILSGKLTVDREPLDLVGIIRPAIDAVRPSAEAKKIALALDLEGDAGRVLADPARLQQVILNLLTNAIKFTPKGGTVRVGLARDGETVKVTVADNGRGIEKHFLPRVFERFQQGEGSVNRVYGGLGLGLAIVRHITELHEGSVEAHSDGPNRGATFVVCLPRLLEVENAFARPSALPVSGEKLEGLNVLVVDDENDTRELVQMLLERHGAFVISAASVDEALSALNARVPDVIVSDIGMPHEDGNVLLQKVRALPNEQGGKVPALALTAFAGLADRTRALSSGFNMYVTKPVNPSELVLSVASLAGRLHRA